MGKKGKGEKADNKRERSDDEVSPKSTQEAKQTKMEERTMEVILAKLEKLDHLEAIQNDIASMKAAQTEFFSSLKSLGKKVDNLEKDVKLIKDSQNSDETMKEVKRIQRKNNTLEQSLVNDRIIIRNLPLSVYENKSLMKSTVCKILTTLDLDINEDAYDAYAIKVNSKMCANIVMRFVSTLLKVRVIKKFRGMRRERGNDCPWLVENIVEIPNDHHLNGKQITIANKLTSANADLIQQARKHVPSHFNFVFDTPEGLIMVKINDKFHKIEAEDDIEQLIGSTTAKRDESNSQQTPATTGKTRSVAKKKVGG